MFRGIILNHGIPQDEFGVTLKAGNYGAQKSQASRLAGKCDPNLAQHVTCEVADFSQMSSNWEVPEPEHRTFNPRAGYTQIAPAEPKAERGRHRHQLY